MRVHKTHLRLVGLLALVAILVSIGLSVDPARLLSPQSLRGLAAERPWHAAGAFLAAGMSLKLLFIPISPLSFVGGLVFGGVVGGTLAFVAIFVSSLVGFALGRWLGRSWVEEFVDDEGSRLRVVERLLREYGLLAVVVLRVVPTLPLSALNLLLGHSSVRARDYLLGTALGILPGVYLLAFVGDEALQPGGPEFWIYLTLCGLFLVGGVLLGLRLKRRIEA